MIDHMTKKPKKPHYIRPPFEPDWEDEEAHESPQKILENSRLKQEEDSRLFKDAFEHGKIPVKDSAKEISENFANHSGNSKQRPTKKSSSGRMDIDLHGMTVKEAQHHVIHAISTMLDQAHGRVLEIRVITGKGNHSQGRQPQLISSIHHIVEARFNDRIISMEVSPHEIQLGGAFVKGHFDLRIK
jgi:DNA-nicking Smr family endonuclease